MLQYITIMSSFCPYKIDVALKLLLDQNPIVVYHKFPMVILRATSILGGYKGNM
jgi:hypothetical protein